MFTIELLNILKNSFKKLFFITIIYSLLDLYTDWIIQKNGIDSEKPEKNVSKTTDSKI